MQFGNIRGGYSPYQFQLKKDNSAPKAEESKPQLQSKAADEDDETVLTPQENPKPVDTGGAGAYSGCNTTGPYQPMCFQPDPQPGDTIQTNASGKTTKKTVLDAKQALKLHNMAFEGLNAKTAKDIKGFKK